MFLTFALPGALAETPAAKPRPNVILITIDTVRADHVGCYGANNVQTPTLDSLARDGIVIDRAIAQVPLTWPSHTVILTGTYPFQNGVQDFTGTPLAPQFRSVAQAFKEHGYRTGAVVSAFVLDRSWGLARGFDLYDDAFSPEAFKTKDIGLVDRRAGESVDRALKWLAKAAAMPGPFFFWLHLYDPHSPYDPPEPYRAQYRDHPYDGEIAYADHELGRVIAWLKAHQLYSRTAIIATSDHGESLGEHGEQEHGFFIYNSTTRVPLIVKPAAGSGFQADRVARPVETVQIAPTLLSMARIKDAPIEKQFTGHDLFAKDADNATYSETFYPFSSFGWSPLHALELGRFRYIDAPRPELYDETSDPDEKNNLAAQQPATVTTLKQKLQEVLRHPVVAPSSTDTGVPRVSPPLRDPGLPPDAAEKLRALGYVAYKSPVTQEQLAKGLADPKDKIEEFNMILQAQDAMRAGDLPRGEALLAKVQQQDPNMYIVHFSLGEAAARNKDWEKSAAEFQKCLDLNPNFDQAMTGLSRALYYLGKDEDAIKWAKNALKINPTNYKAIYELASIESRTDRQAAIADYQRAIAIQANFAPLHRELGLLYFQDKNYAAALTHLSKAAELGINDAELFNFLGLSYMRTGFVEKAIDSYRRALARNPDLAEAHLNLGYAYQTAGQVSQGRLEYEAACRLMAKFCQYVPDHQQ